MVAVVRVLTKRTEILMTVMIANSKDTEAGQKNNEDNVKLGTAIGCDETKETSRNLIRSEFLIRLTIAASD